MIRIHRDAYTVLLAAAIFIGLITWMLAVMNPAR